MDNLSSMHNAFLKMGIGTDVINWTEELDGYKLVIVPSLFLLNEEVAQRLERFAAGGGTVVLTNRTGVKNMRNVCEMLPLPGLLAEAAGVVVSEYDAIGNSEHRIRTRRARHSLRSNGAICWNCGEQNRLPGMTMIFTRECRRLLSISLVKVRCIMSALGRSHRISISCSKAY